MSETRSDKQDPPWIALLRHVPLAMVLGGLGAVFGWGVRYATYTSMSESTVERVARLEASVNERFQRLETGTDTRFKEGWARMDQIDRDRESRTVISNKLTSDLGDALRSQIDGVNRKLDQRSEARGAQVNDLTQRLSNLELRVCVMANNRISQCK